MTTDHTNNTLTENDGTNKIDDPKQNMHSMVKIVTAKEGLMILRCETTNDNPFKTFMNYYLTHMTTSVQWRYHAYSTNITDIFTVSDEVLCVLTVENHANDLIYIHK